MPRTYLPEGYKGPLTEDQVRRYLSLKGVELDTDKMTFREFKALNDLGLDRTSSMMPNLFGMNPKRDPLKAIQKAEDEEFKKKAVPYKAPPITPFDYNMMKAGEGPIQRIGKTLGVLGVPEDFKPEEKPKIVSWSKDVNGIPFPIYDKPQDPTPYVDQSKRPWDLVQPHKIDPEQAESVVGRADISTPQKVVNTVYGAGRAMFDPIFNAVDAVSGGKVQTPPEAPIPPAETAVGRFGQDLAVGGMGLAGFIAGPAKLAGGPADLAASTFGKIATAEKFGGPLVRKLLEHGVRSGVHLGVASVLSDVRDPASYQEKFAGGARTGLGFAIGGLINARSSRVLDKMLRQFGGRVALSVMGQYNPNETTVYNELLNTYFLNHGVTIGDVLNRSSNIREEHKRNGLPGQFPTDGEIIRYITRSREGAAKVAEENPDMKELLAGTKPDLSAIEARLQQEYSLTGDPDIAAKQERDRREAARAMGLPGAEPSPLKPIDTASTIPVSGPQGGRERAPRPGERNWPSREEYEDYEESFAGAGPTRKNMEDLETYLKKKYHAEQTVVVPEDATSWIRGAGIDWQPDMKAVPGDKPIDMMRKVMGTKGFDKMSVFDRARILAEIERGHPESDRNIPYSETMAAGKNKKTAWKVFDFIRGCGNNCISCYANKMAIKSGVDQRTIVHSKNTGVLSPGEIGRIGNNGDPMWDWKWSQDGVNETIARSKAKNPNASVDDFYWISKLLTLDGFDPKVVRRLEVSLDPIYPAHMATTMENILKIRQMDPSVRILPRLRTTASTDPALKASQDYAIHWLKSNGLPVLETRMRFNNSQVMKALALDPGQYHKYGNQWKGPQMVPREFGTDSERLLCDKMDKGKCQVCLNCVKGLFPDKNEADIRFLADEFKGESYESLFANGDKALAIRDQAIMEGRPIVEGQKVWEPRTTEEKALAERAAAGQTTLGPHRAGRAFTFDEANRYGTIEDIYANQERADMEAEAPDLEGQAVKADRYRPEVTHDEWKTVRDEISTRLGKGEFAIDIAKDLKKRGYNAKHTDWNTVKLERTPTPAMRKAAGEPVGAPEDPGRYPMGKNIGKNTTKGGTKPPYMKTVDKTLWDTMRRMAAGSEGSYNLLRDEGLPKPEDFLGREAYPWQRAAFWVNEKGQYETNIRKVLQKIVDGPVPEWFKKYSENNPVRGATPEQLKADAEYLLSLPHVDGPVRWGVDKRSGVGGVYEPDTGLITLNPTNPGSLINAIHEGAHGATMRFRTRLDSETWDKLQEIYNRTRSMAGPGESAYGDTDVFEHAAEALANPQFRKRNETMGQRTADELVGQPSYPYHGLTAEQAKQVSEKAKTVGEESQALSRGVAGVSREGLDVSAAAHPKGLKITKVTSADGFGPDIYRIEMPGGQTLFDHYREYPMGRSDEQVLTDLRKMVNEKFIQGSYLAGVRPSDADLERLEQALQKASDADRKAVGKVLIGAPGVSKKDEQAAIAFFRKMEEAEPSKAPAAPGVPLKSDRSILPYGTVEKADLEKGGIVYKGEVGKPQQLLDEYDKHAATLKAVGEREPVLSPEMDKPLPDRPSNFAEVFPEANIVKDFIKVAGETKKGGQGWFETGLRFVERAGGGPMNVIKEVFYTPMKRGADEVNKSLAKVATRMRGIAQYVGLTTKYKDSIELGKWLAVRQHGGEKTLELSGIPASEAEGYKAGTPPEPIKKMMNWMDNQLLQAFHEINKERIRAGEQPIEWRQDYFTFWHAADALNQRGMSLYSTPKEKFDEAVAEWNKNYENDLNTKQAEFRSKSRFSKWMFQKRTGNLGPIDLDAYGVFTRYMHSAYEQMYLAQAQSVMKKLVDGSWEVDGKEWKLSTENKPMADALSNYLGFIATGVKPGEIPKPIFEVFNKLGRNVAVGKVGANFKSSLNQLTSNIHSWSTLGTKYWTKGFADYAKAQADGIGRGWVEGGKWAEAKEVGDLATRRREIAFEEFMNKRPRTKFGRGMQKAGEIGMAPLQMLDMVTAEITWRGAYQKAMDGNAEGMMGQKGVHERAVDYANAEVVRTQGSTQKADLTPFQRGQWGKVLSVLQNFTINEWGFVTRDVMGVNNADKGNPEHVKRAVRFMVGAFVLDWVYEEVLGIRSPFNVLANPMQTIRPAAEEYKKSGNVLKAAGAGAVGAASTLPLIGRGFTPYGAGGGLGAGVETLQKGGELIRRPSVPGVIDWAGSLAGIPGSFAASRALKIREKGGTWPQAVAGATPEKKSTKPKKVYDPETGTWKPAPQTGGSKKKPRKTYNPETGAWE